jgi:8-oxo-dGTP pyrophosphatase MutT (NUDIX family)
VAGLLGDRAPATLPAGPPRAAVLLLLFDVERAAHLLLTKRSMTVGHHRGQISLPGGRREPQDPDLVATALRETEEEVGVPRRSVRILGELDEVHARGSDNVIRPVVGLAGGPVRATPNDREVARVMQVPLAELLALDAALPPEPPLMGYRYPLLGEDVWGATARILRGFAGLLTSAAGGGPATAAPEGRPGRDARPRPRTPASPAG